MSIMDEKLREFNRFTGDGLADEPVGAPLPIGDPRSGAFTPQKKDLRVAFAGVLVEVEAAVAGVDDFKGNLVVTATSGVAASASFDPVTTTMTFVLPEGPEGPVGPAGVSGDMFGANNLSDLTDIDAARTNLELGGGSSVVHNALTVTATGTTSPTSTGHGQQVGPTSGENTIAGANRIQARDNGAVADLELNPDGGDVLVGGSPVVTAATMPAAIAGWHPYDMVTAGDGADGLIYDQAVDGDMAAVETPAFEDGYEYLLTWTNTSVWNNISFGIAPPFKVSAYLETTGAFEVAVTNTVDLYRADVFSGSALFRTPRLVTEHHTVSADMYVVNGASLEPSTGGVVSAIAEKISKAKIHVSSYYLDQGQIFLYRRQENISA